MYVDLNFSERSQKQNIDAIFESNTSPNRKSSRVLVPFNSLQNANTTDLNHVRKRFPMVMSKKSSRKTSSRTSIHITYINSSSSVYTIKQPSQLFVYVNKLHTCLEASARNPPPSIAASGATRLEQCKPPWKETRGNQEHVCESALKLLDAISWMFLVHPFMCLGVHHDTHTDIYIYVCVCVCELELFHVFVQPYACLKTWH